MCRRNPLPPSSGLKCISSGISSVIHASYVRGGHVIQEGRKRQKKNPVVANWSRDSAVGIATGYKLEDRGV
jgi:hypothetical protein